MNNSASYERTPVVLEIKNLTKKFPVDGGKFLTACDNITLTAYEGRTLGIIGESGCGKSTLVRCLLGIQSTTSGEAIFNGKDILKATGEEKRQNRKLIQMVFQDPNAAFNPKMLVKDILTEPLKNFGMIKSSEVDAKASELLEMVELPASFKDRYPHSMSGGQRQRLGIAALWHWSLRLLSAMRRPQHWTFPYRKRSASCCASCKRKRISLTCSSPMIWVW